MKRLLLATILGISALATRAADFRDNDVVNVNINKIGGPVSGEFNLVTAGIAPDVGGFIPGSSIPSAVATFDVHANGNHSFLFDIELDGIMFAQNVAISGPNTDLSVNGDGVIDGLGANAANELAILAALALDGKLTYKLTRKDDDEATLGFNIADLVVKADGVIPPSSVPTPDGGSTFALAGIALAAVASLRRKLSK
jgi:hypothetical protein